MRLFVAALVGAVAAIGTIVALSTRPSQVAAAPNTSPLIVIFMENKERSSIEGSGDADYLKGFEAGGISFTHYYGVTHPSLPNYLAVASGSTKGKTGSDSVAAGELTGKTLWSQMSTQRLTWAVYMESMPSACYAGGSSGEYVLRHNPATPFMSVFSKPKRCRNVVPYSSFSTSALPALAFIAPNLCNDMHDCSIATGDNWLQARVPAMLAAGATVVITFDEGSSSDHGGGNVYAAVDGPGVDHRVATGTFNHYNLLAALESRLELARLNNAVGKAALPLA